MFKNRIKAPPVLNVVSGQNATLSIDPGPRLHAVILYATATKTAATSGFTSLTLSDVLGMLTVNVNTSPKRSHLAQELNEIQMAYEGVLAAQKFDSVDNNFNAVADTTGTYNSIACTNRSTTWVLIMNFSEPYRDSYTARAAFAWPTSWVSTSGTNAGAVIGTANIQLQIGIPATSTSGLTVSNYQTAFASGNQFIQGYAVRAELVTDTATGPLNKNGTPIMPVTHFYRQAETYSNTTPVFRNWPFIGQLSQTSFFSPNGGTDNVTAIEVLLNNSIIVNTSKQGDDLVKLSYDWNAGHLQTTAGDLSGTNWPAANVFHLAFDFDDNPKAWLGYDGTKPLEYDLTLGTATSSSKVLYLVHQVWRDALTS